MSVSGLDSVVVPVLRFGLYMPADWIPSLSVLPKLLWCRMSILNPSNSQR